MNIFHFHPVDGSFLCMGSADADPLDTGAWLIPAFSTAVAPPTTPSNSLAKFIDGNWVVGLKPEPATPTPPTLAEIKAIKWEAIKAKRDRLSEIGGYLVTVGGAVKWFHSDGKSKTQQLGLARKADRLQTAGGNLSANFAGPGPGGTLPWKTMDGSYVLMTGVLAQAIVDAAEQQDMALFAVATYHATVMNASATPETYDFSAGWPATYTA
jgi:Domain of unknown function (DUF4376)